MSQVCIDLFNLLCWFATLANDNLLIIAISIVVVTIFLRVHYSYNITPLVVDTFLFELMTDSIYYPINQQTQVKMRHRCSIFFVINGPEIEICF